jgi:hypothetical protein
MVQYIVFDTEYKIIATFQSFGGDISTLLKSDSTLRWINITHPLHSDIKAKINAVNNTKL